MASSNLQLSASSVSEEGIIVCPPQASFTCLCQGMFTNSTPTPSSACLIAEDSRIMLYNNGTSQCLTNAYLRATESRIDMFGRMFQSPSRHRRNSLAPGNIKKQTRGRSFPNQKRIWQQGQLLGTFEILRIPKKSALSQSPSSSVSWAWPAARIN
ncbi:hypothetical protein CEXT_91481 [Caerostris extrusa]|uniref:Uncharacterized protein n=1 Tax=Caerostris extrusa TaxID=172846 RepID=A0AAV4XDW3_CAEEX|nr:hypothetical protein CEXT_91481 [Caerostris extrusa]